MSSTKESVKVENTSVFTLYEFVKSLSNSSKLSLKTVATILSNIDKEKFELIKTNENMALKRLKDLLINSIYEVIINKISYDIKEINIKNTAFMDKDGELRDYLNGGALGRDVYKIKNKEVLKRSIYNENFMEVDSEIEKMTIDESSVKSITVFGKLPKVSIPTPHGRSYSPDFGYVIEGKNEKELYLVVETKGYDSISDIDMKEQLKIKSAEKFFEQLKYEKGIEVLFKTKINKDELSGIITEIKK
jgi:type III restriction enzyme